MSILIIDHHRPCILTGTMPVIWERRTTDLDQVREAPYRGQARVQSTPCYDFLFSLGALYNTRMFDATRVWARIWGAGGAGTVIGHPPENPYCAWNCTMLSAMGIAA